MPTDLERLIADAIAIKQQSLDKLFTMRNVVGIGIGFKVSTPLYPELAAAHRVVAFDWPGYGESASSPGASSTDFLVDFLAALLDELRIHKASLVGISMGGAAALGFTLAATVSRLSRSAMLEVISQDYIRTARAKGLKERVVIYKHALRNALLPVVTLLAFLLPGMFGGSVIIESIFSIPGMGQLSFEAVLSRDYPVIMAIAAISALLTLVGLLLSDLLYAALDPRIKLE